MRRRDMSEYIESVIAVVLGVLGVIGWFLNNLLNRIKSIEDKFDTKVDKEDYHRVIDLIQTDLRSIAKSQEEILRWIAKSKPCKD